MAFPSGKHLKITAHWNNTTSGGTATSLFYYTVTAGPDPAGIGAMPTLANFFKDDTFAEFAAVMPIGIAIPRVEAIWNFASVQWDGMSTGTGISGTISGDILPEEDCVILQKRTGTAGRNKRGRWFIPYVPESAQKHGELEAATITAWETICNVLRTPRVDPDTSTTYTPVLPDSKTGTWVPLQDVRIVNQIGNKRGRRFPKKLTVTGFSFP